MSNEQLSVAVGIDTFTPTQLSQLVYLASQCPLAGGASVFRARSLLTLVTDTFFDDKSICAAQGIYFKKEPTAVKETQPEELQLSLLPNPAKDYLYIQAKQLYANELQLTVTDYTGKIVLQEVTHFVNSRIRVNIDRLSNGVYIVKLQDERGLNFSSKFHVLH